jgi:probable rRNA maturation factor
VTLPFTLEIAANIQDSEWEVQLPMLRDLYIATTNKVVERLIERDRTKLSPDIKATVEISILFTDDANIKILNREYRNQNKPTNVLSFPDTEISKSALDETAKLGESLFLGDIILARETIFTEAVDQHKSILDHLSHMLVHSLLHLAGYDHIDDDEAEEMEALEIKILAELNISNPYDEMPARIKNRDVTSNE